jgi:Tfp pilus assembly protein PilF
MEEYRRALALNPNDADLVAEYGDTLTYWGTPQDAIIELKRAMKINPLYPDWYRWNLAFALFSVQAYEESLQELARISQPHNNVHLIIAANHVRLGNGDNARAPINEFLKLEPDYTIGKLRRRTAFRILKDEEHWLGAVREAGVGD